MESSPGIMRPCVLGNSALELLGALGLFLFGLVVLIVEDGLADLLVCERGHVDLLPGLLIYCLQRSAHDAM